MASRGYWLCILPSLALAAASFPGIGTSAETDGSSAAKTEYNNLVKEHKDAEQDYFKAAAKTKYPQERAKLLNPANPYATKFLALTEKYPKDPVALDSLLWVAENCRSSSELNPALRSLLTDYANDTNLLKIVGRLSWWMNDTVPFLGELSEKTSNESLKANTLFALGKTIGQRASLVDYLADSPEREIAEHWKTTLGDELFRALQTNNAAQLRKEAERLFATIVDKYGHVQGRSRKLGEAAKSELFELRHLAIGMVAPEIAGEDLDGRTFKLSDYRGKVVVLDFWGDW